MSSSTAFSSAPTYTDSPPPYSPAPPPHPRSRSQSAPSPAPLFLAPTTTTRAAKAARRTRSNTASSSPAAFAPRPAPDFPPSYLAGEYAVPLPIPYLARCSSGMGFDTDDDDEHADAIYTAKAPARPPSAPRARARTGSAAAAPPKHARADHPPAAESESETEGDVRRRLPPRGVPAAEPLIPLSTLAKLTPWLFGFARWLAIVPSAFGALYNLFSVVFPPPGGPARVDFFVSLVWCLLTGFQCLRLTTGLLVRWRAYYPPLATLIRLLALQAICWPATHFTLTLLRHEVRPVVCWAAIGTTTCCSRAIQIWVTSNLVAADGRAHALHHRLRHHLVHPVASGADLAGAALLPAERRGGRRWDWAEVGARCALPAGICYFIMAWAEVLRREFEGC